MIVRKSPKEIETMLRNSRMSCQRRENCQEAARI